MTRATKPNGGICFASAKAHKPKSCGSEVGEKLSCQGSLKIELYRGSDGEPKISRTIFVDDVLTLSQPPRERKPRADNVDCDQRPRVDPIPQRRHSFLRTRAMTTLDAALRYAARGWPVFPCRGKIPLTPHGFHDASTDAATIEAWWRENPDALISVATGASAASSCSISTSSTPGRTAGTRSRRSARCRCPTRRCPDAERGNACLLRSGRTRHSAFGRQDRPATRRPRRALMLHLADAGNGLSLGSS